MLTSRLEIESAFIEFNKILDKDVKKIQEFLDYNEPERFKVEYYVDELDYYILISVKEHNNVSIYKTGFAFIKIEVFPKYKITIENKPLKEDINVMRRHPDLIVNTIDLEYYELIEAAYDFLKTEFFEGEM